MQKVAQHFSSISALICEQNYNYEIFGSWWCIFKISGKSYRLIFDGRESTLSLQTNASGSVNDRRQMWGETHFRPVNSNSSNDVILSEIKALLTKLNES